MASTTLDDLRAKTDTAFRNITTQLQGMEPHLDRADAPGEWTTRDVVCHLLGQPGWDIAGTLGLFSRGALPVIDLQAGQKHTTEERRRMTLPQLVEGLDAQRRQVFGYLAGLPEADLTARKARIPLFKQFMGTDEIPLATFVGAMLDFHWNDHAGQLAKIRKTAGLPEGR